MTALSVVLEAAARALVLAGLAGAGITVLRVKRPELLLRVWTLVLCGALVLPVLGRVGPGIQWTVPVPAGVQQVFFASSRGAVLGTGAAGAPAAGSTAGTTWKQRVSAVGWSTLLAGVYAVGLSVMLLRVGLGWLLTVRLRRSMRPMADGAVLTRLARIAEPQRVAVPGLAESSRLLVPVTLDALRPTIVLPDSWREWDAARLEAVLAHELSHAARRDVLRLRLALVYRAVTWFSPLGWWLHRRLADLADQAADATALAGGADRASYAETVLDFLRVVGPHGRRAEWHVAMARRADASAERRLDRILAWGSQTIGTRRAGTMAATVALVAVPAVVLIATVKPEVPRVNQSVDAPSPARPSATVHAGRAATPVGVEPPDRVTPPAPVPQARGGGASRTRPSDPVYQPGPGIQNPKVISRAEPKYPIAAQLANVEGQVELDAQIAKDGTVADVQVVKSLSPELDQAAEAAARMWRFEPGTKDGVPVPVSVRLVMEFKLPPPTARGSRVYALGPGLVAPVLVSKMEPKYTAEALRAKIQGTVRVEAIVGTDGTVGDVRVVESLDQVYGLDEQAVAAVKEWRFEAGTLNGEPVPVQVTLMLEFRLH